MTRRSRRELERELASLSGDAKAATVREFVDDVVRDGWNVAFDDERERTGDLVVLCRGDGFTVDVAPEELPEWVDEADLPIQA